MILMYRKERIAAIKQAPLTWKEFDIITGAERYMNNIIDFPMVDFVLPCFPKIENQDGDLVLEKIDLVWQYQEGALGLLKESEGNKYGQITTLLQKASRIYEQEAQRHLGAIFPVDHAYWNAFYKRQEHDFKKPLVALDAVHFYTNCREEIGYQLLIQSLQLILKGPYSQNKIKNELYSNAMRLVIDLPLKEMKSWLNDQIVNL